MLISCLETWLVFLPTPIAASKPDYPMLPIKKAKKFMLYRSLFDLVNCSYCLSLDDERLHKWYFGISMEERQIIQDEGGLLQFLLNHPALEVANKIGIVHVKPQIRKAAEEIAANMNRSRMQTVQMSWCKKCGTNCAAGSETCRTCNVSAAVTEERMLLGQKMDSTAIQSSKSKQKNIATNALNDTSAQSSFFVDGSPPAFKAQFGTVRDNRSYLALREEAPAEYSFNSSPYALQASVDSLVGASAGHTENGAKLFPTEDPVSSLRRPSEWVNLDITNDKSPQNKTKDMSVNSELWLNCSVTQEKPRASPSQKLHVDLPVKLSIEKGQQTPRKEEKPVAVMSVSPDKSSVQLPVSAPATVNQMVDASGDFRAGFTCTQECAATPSTSDASTEIHLPLCIDHDTQTQASTADKCVITEVYIADLEYLTEEFLRLQSVEREMIQVKANLLKPPQKEAKCGCECGERLKQAELQLLALQYSMCLDHCWRRYYTSAQGGRLQHCPGKVPKSLAETLQALEQNYRQLRRKVLSGATLDELTPLSVDTQKLNAEAHYTPAEIMNENVEEAPAELTVASPHKNETDNAQIHSTGPQNMQKLKGELCKDAVPHPRPVGFNGSEVVYKKSSRPGGSEEGGNVTSEAWYDAEEDFGVAAPNSMEEFHRKALQSTTDGKVGDGDGVSSGCVLYVSDVHQDITEEDLFALKKYHPRDVHFTVSNKSRSATVTMSSPEHAETAAQELSGTLIHGQPTQLKHLCRPPAAVGPEGGLAFKKPHAPPAPKPKTSGNASKPGSEKKSTPYNMSPKPLRCRMAKLLNISDVPTATGTYVPQEPAPANPTTSTFTFGTLMRHLSERHPLLGREQILGALLELRGQHRGSLNCLTLEALVEMTSEHITAQAPGSE